MEPGYVAVDLGAGSGRMLLGRFGEECLDLEELHRFANAPRTRAGHERWLVHELFAEICEGLRRLPDQGRGIASLGVDTWGVDYGLLDREGALIEEPVTYRDARTEGVIARVEAIIPRQELFARTGLQLLPFNTLFQLFAQVRSGEWPDRAATLLFMPDLFHHFLCGSRQAERTAASTSMMLQASGGAFDRELLHRLELPVEILSPLVEPGTELGVLRAELQAELGLHALPIVAPAGHDTASAVAGTPLREGWAYVSSGTWSLVGIETRRAFLDERAMAGNLTNEGGVEGTTRLLKNVMGLWILERCRDEWQALSHDELQGELAAAPPTQARIDPDDARFFHPASMVTEVRGFLAETGQPAPEDQVTLSQIVLLSLADRYAEVLGQIEKVTGETIAGLHIIGGGSQNAFLNQATAHATGLPVRAGPVEATALGNLCVQAIAGGRFADLAEARAYLARHVPARRFEPA